MSGFVRDNGGNPTKIPVKIPFYSPHAVEIDYFFEGVRNKMYTTQNTHLTEMLH
jgi:hypothetical protein